MDPFSKHDHSLDPDDKPKLEAITAYLDSKSWYHSKLIRSNFCLCLRNSFFAMFDDICLYYGLGTFDQTQGLLAVKEP